ncbi:MAG: hypothetical protein OEZ02_14165 [Anaerolineae bacterium]|nr:hypothetical protein [Anaerolineae bacterium]
MSQKKSTAIDKDPFTWLWVVLPLILVTLIILFIFRNAKSPQLPENQISNKNIQNLEMIYRLGKGEISQIAVSPSGNHVAAASSFGIWIYQTDNFKNTALFEGHTGEVTNIAWSPGGKYLASGSKDHTVRVWNAATGEEINVFEGHKQPITSLSWSPDGDLLLSGDADGEIIFWDMETAKETQRQKGFLDRVDAAAWSPDNQFVAIVGNADNSFWIWNSILNSNLHVYQNYISNITFAAWAPDAKKIALSGDQGSVAIWDMEKAEIISYQANYIAYVVSLAWSSDGRWLAVAGADSAETGGGKLNQMKYAQTDVFNYSNKVYGGGWKNSTIRIWDWEKKEDKQELNNGMEMVRSISWLPGANMLVSAEENHALKKWDIEKGAAVLAIEGNTSSVMDAAWSPDSKLLVSSGYDHHLRFWDSQSGTRIHFAPKDDGIIMRELSWSPNGERLAYIGGNKTVNVLDRDWQEISFKPHNLKGPVKLIWSADSRFLAVRNRWTPVSLYTVEKDELNLILKNDIFNIRSMAWSPNRPYLAFGTSDAKIKIWNASEGTMAGELQEENQTWNSRFVSWSPDGERIAAVNNLHSGSIIIWDVGKKDQLFSIKSNIKEIEVMKWSPTGEYISVLGRMNTESAIQVIDSASGKNVQIFSSDTGYLSQLHWSPDGSLIASTDDTFIHIWDIQSKDEVMRLGGHAKLIRGAAWSPDGKYLASWSLDGTIVVWGILGID